VKKTAVPHSTYIFPQRVPPSKKRQVNFRGNPITRNPLHRHIPLEQGNYNNSFAYEKRTRWFRERLFSLNPCNSDASPSYFSVTFVICIFVGPPEALATIWTLLISFFLPVMNMAIF